MCKFAINVFPLGTNICILGVRFGALTPHPPPPRGTTEGCIMMQLS